MSGDLRLCTVSASGQNAFFDEILEAFGAALAEHGLIVERSVDCFPAPADDLVYIYVPHEYHSLVHELAHPTPVQLARSVALCTEQPGTPWFDVSCEIAAHAGAVLDINSMGVRALAERGIPAEIAPLGYVREWDAWQRDETAERSIDWAFLGAHTDRRAEVLANCASGLPGVRAALHLCETRPHPVGSTSFLSHDAKWRLLADTKVLVNVHRSPLAYMEWQRVLGAVLNGCVVLSEHSVGIDPFVPGEHFISADCDSLPFVLEALLSDPERMRTVRLAAYDLVRDRMPPSAMAEPLLRAAERAASTPVPAEAGSAPSPVPLPKPPPERAPEWEARVDWLGDQLPLRVALKHLVAETAGLRRQVRELSSDGEPVAITVEEMGPARPAPRVSVLLTVYDYADLVGAALRSVASSELSDVEVVVVDDGSSDGSTDAVRAACAELDGLTVRLVQRSENGGLPAARNLALSHARADLVFVLDADNRLLPRGLGLLATALEEHPEAGFAYGVIQSFGPSGPVGLMNWLAWDPRRLRHGNYIDAMAMIRRSALETVGGYPTETALHGWEDFAVWVAMADAGLGGVHVPDFVGCYRTGSYSMLSLTDIDHSAAWAKLLRMYPSLSNVAAHAP